MTTQTMQGMDILKAGFSWRLLRADEIEIRVAQVKTSGVSLLLYKTARTDVQILNETVGPMFWKKWYNDDLSRCTVSIYNTDIAQWVSREDVGTTAKTEPAKSLASDAMKRACFAWGIGIELYTSPRIFIPADRCRIDGGKCFTNFIVQDIDYHGRRICYLRIGDVQTGRTLYTWGQKPTQDPAPYVDALKTRLAEADIPATYITEAFHVDSVDVIPLKALQALLTDRGWEKMTASYMKEQAQAAAQAQAAGQTDPQADDDVTLPMS